MAPSALTSTNTDVSEPCSGNGDCRCGKCECHAFGERGWYHGEYCERFNSQCDRHEECVLCMADAALKEDKVLGNLRNI